jgi:UDP-glucose 4-epimerase
VKSLVIGSGGLIGSAVCSQVGFGRFQMEQEFRIRWESKSQAIDDIKRLLREFQALVSNDTWAIYWCAGKGHLRASQSELSKETELLASVFETLRYWENQNGVFTLCSSAGAIWYAPVFGSINELTPESGKSTYAQAKLTQESLLTAACRAAGFRGVIARLSNVYGSNQDLSKTQGLISRLCFSATSQLAIGIYVPLETTRNYLFASDAARMMKVFAETHLLGSPPSSVIKKIICSRESQSIAKLINVVQLVSGKKPNIVQGKTLDSGSYPLHFHIQSQVEPDVSWAEQTTILSGVSDVYKGILRQQQLGVLSAYRSTVSV